ncbi:MAG: flagellar hook protein FlgE [Syntrophorhabdaceae bacterium]|nr:flagellar hook protein FlgE [Syntrophorhabdaceae bacterium]
MLSSLFSGISGLVTNGQSINVVGNNIANVNTVGYKASRTTFQDVLYQSITSATGTSQVGRGSTLGSVDTLFSQGSFESTSEATDLAIGGSGYFIVKSPENDMLYYTRAGQFRFDKEGKMINPGGYIVQGKEIDRATKTPVGVSENIVISPEPSEPKATEKVGMAVNLQSNATWKGTVGSLSGAGTSLTNVAASSGKYPRVGDYTATVSGGKLTLTFTEKGPDGNPTGVTKTWSGTLSASTTYTDWQGSGLDITTASSIADGSQTFSTTGFKYTYESVTSNPTTTSNYSSSISVYDSLGQSHVVNIYFRKAYEDSSTGDSTWQWHAVLEAVDSAEGKDTLAGWGNLVFNNKGTLISGGDPITVKFNFSQGAEANQPIALIFGKDSGGGASTQYPIASTTNFQTQDGYPPGVLQNVTVSEEGIISGHYSNGQILDLYQITLANFNNPQGLKREGGNLFAETLASGPAYTNAPGSGGLGKINSNSLEQSNVDLATEFVKMIIAQRGFQANSRVITTSDEILQELMNLKR